VPPAPVSSVSVVTVCLNARAVIGATLDSVRAQSFAATEHVVMDGGSTDGTVEVLREWQPAQFTSEPDHGIYDAMQKGALAAKGDIVFFLNAGDTFHDEHVLRDVVQHFETTGADAVFGNLLPCYLNTGDTHDHPAFVAGRVLDLSYFRNRRQFFWESIHHQATFYRRSIFEQCGFACQEPAATGEYHLNLCAFVRHGFRLVHLPRVICRFALGGRSTAGFDEELARFLAARTILRRHFFPQGPTVPFASAHEYLPARPGLARRLRFALGDARMRLLWRLRAGRAAQGG
jgi:glycosyltransferase involved in cell wall biosynthesis